MLTSTTSATFQQPNKRYKYPTPSADTSTSSSANDSTSSSTPPLSPQITTGILGNKFNKIANFSYTQQMMNKNYYNNQNYENYPPQQQQQQQQQQSYYGYYNNQNQNRTSSDDSLTQSSPQQQQQQHNAFDLSNCQNNEYRNNNQPLSNISNGSSLPLKKRRAIPSELKDNQYWEKRRKNNESAKRSRDNKRGKEETLIMRNLYLEQENLQLKTQIAMYEAQIENLSKLAHVGLGGHLINNITSATNN